MPIHDWTKAEGWLFHDFHGTWLTHLKEALNDGRMPPGFVAATERHAGVYVPDVQTYAEGNLPQPAGNGVAVAEPHAERQEVMKARRAVRPHRRVVVRTPDRVVAVVEVVSPGNKSRAGKVRAFAQKAADLILGGVHLAVIDLVPPGRFDPGGMHPPIRKRLGTATQGCTPPPGRPLTFAGYRAGGPPKAYLNYAAVGDPVPGIPLFLYGDVYVDLPLEQTYMTGFNRLPASVQAKVE